MQNLRHAAKKWLLLLLQVSSLPETNRRGPAVFLFKLPLL